MGKINKTEKQALAKKSNVRIRNLIYKGIWDTPPEIRYYLVLYTVNQPGHRLHGSTLSYEVAKHHKGGIFSVI